MLLFDLDEFRLQLEDSVFELLSLLDTHLQQILSLLVLLYFLVIDFG